MTILQHTQKAPALRNEGSGSKERPKQKKPKKQVRQQPAEVTQEVEGANTAEATRTTETAEQRQLTPTAKEAVRLNILEALDLITEKMTTLPNPEQYLQMREELTNTLKICQKRLEQYEEKTFIPMLERHQTDNLRLGKYEVSYRPSKKRIIDMEKLKTALIDNPQQINLFLKKPEFKTLEKCRQLLLKLGVYSDVYSVKIGKQPILNIKDTNTIKRKLEETAELEDEE
jgi:hypothetical protein